MCGEDAKDDPSIAHWTYEGKHNGTARNEEITETLANSVMDLELEPDENGYLRIKGSE